MREARPNQIARAEFVADFGKRLALDERLRPYRAHADRPAGPAPKGPQLHLEDVSEIPFLNDIAGVELYQHRARVRAGDGDLFAAVTPAAPGYEAYCQDIGLGRPDLLLAEPTRGHLAVAKACLEGPTFSALVEAARRAERLTVHPYMGIEPVWALAGALSAAAGVPVSVRAPPPPVTWIANDKFLFGQLVDGLLGPGYLIETQAFTEAGGLGGALAQMAGRHRRVGLKRTRCASAMGNRIYESQALREAGPSAVAQTVQAFLVDTEWPAGEEVLVVQWVETDHSPSTQLWIPPAGGGPVRLEGIYDQILEPIRKVFVGSRPSRLPESVKNELAEASLIVAEGLQALGYVGRCSFDFVVVPEAPPPSVRFVECNGRWGGTSTPMFLVDRLVEGPRPPYRAQDMVHPELVGVPFDEIRAALGGHLFDPKTQEGAFVLYNVGPLQTSGKLDVIALADRPEEADALLDETFFSLLGVNVR